MLLNQVSDITIRENLVIFTSADKSSNCAIFKLKLHIMAEQLFNISSLWLNRQGKASILHNKVTVLNKFVLEKC